ncbi:MAG: Uma2 family endonuclease, partial [Bacteroidota bacterium]
MSAVAIRNEYYSIAEYLALEEQALERHEYHDGWIRAMSGGTINHGLLCSNAVSTLYNANRTKGNKCTALGSEVKVRIAKDNSFVYPDAMLICGNIETAEEDPNAV